MDKNSAETAFYEAVRALNLELDGSIVQEIHDRGKAAMGEAYHNGKSDERENLKRNILALFD